MVGLGLHLTEKLISIPTNHAGVSLVSVVGFAYWRLATQAARPEKTDAGGFTP